MQIRNKLTIQFIILVASILILSLYNIFHEFEKMNEVEFYNTLRSKALMTAEMVLHDERHIHSIENESNDTAPTLPTKDNVTIFNDKGEKIFALNNDDKNTENILGNSKDKEIHQRRGDSYTLGLRFVSPEGNDYVVVAKSKINAIQIKNLRNILISTFFFIIILVAIGGWFYTGQALAPVAKIVTQVDAILPNNLIQRLTAPKSKDEIGKLTLTFNNLLDRIHKAFTMQKNFISNVSHEIKNPIAVIISQIEVTLSQENRTNENYRQTLNSVLYDAQELANTTDNLLHLARVQSTEHEDLKTTIFQLDESILSARQNVLRMHKDFHVHLNYIGHIEDEQTFAVKGNEILLRSVFSNLIDNACKYSSNNTASVEIIVEKEQNTIRVSNDGIEISTSERALFLQPFYRDPKHKHIKGTGIGLALVDNILKLHELQLRIDSNADKTSFSVSFPSVK